MKSTAKAIAQFRTLKQELDFRLAGSVTIDTTREAFDADGWPMLFLSNSGAETASNAVVLLRMKGRDAVSKDILGNAIDAFTPHIIEVAYELTAGGAPTPSALDLAKIQIEVDKIGCRTQIKQVANTVAVTESSLNSTAVAADLEYDVKQPGKGM